MSNYTWKTTRAAAARLMCGAAIALLSITSQAAPPLGVYRWEPAPGPSNVDAFGQWLGRSVDVASAFTGAPTAEQGWQYIEGMSWQLGPWSQWVRAKPGRNLSYAVALFPRGGSLASCAAGQYDAHYRNLANNLAYYGLHWAYLRLGWEMDGGWYAWGAPSGSGKEASFAGCFRRVVQVMRQTQPANQWKFVFNPTDIAWPNAAYLEAIWPGDAYVNVVGVDSYDSSWWPNTYPYPSTCDAACRLQRQQTVWNFRVARLNTLRDFAIKHGKAMAFPEWGLMQGKTVPHLDHGGLDNPFYIQKMHDFLMNPANNVVMHAYFDVATSQADYRVGPQTNFAASSALFKRLFGTTAGAPTVSITSPKAGQTVSGTVAYGASATDNAGVSRVDFFVGSTKVLGDTASPYGGTLDTTKLVNGTHLLKAIAYDAQGLSATSQVSFYVQNASTGSTGPTGVAFTAPAAGATISGSFSDSTGCQVTGTGIVRVVFFMDNTQLNTESWAPWQCKLDTRQFANGTHTLRAVAYNSAGASTSVTRTVSVKN